MQLLLPDNSDLPIYSPSQLQQQSEVNKIKPEKVEVKTESLDENTNAKDTEKSIEKENKVPTTAATCGSSSNNLNSLESDEDVIIIGPPFYDPANGLSVNVLDVKNKKVIIQNCNVTVNIFKS